MSEHTPSHNQAPVINPTEVLAFRSEYTGAYQLADSFSTPDSTFEWDAHPYTTSDVVARKTKERRAIIETEDRLYYLLGDSIFSFTSIDERAVINSMTVPAEGMPDVTIGKDVLFSTSPVKRVTVARERVTGEGAEAYAVEHGANFVGESIFDTLDVLLIESGKAREAALEAKKAKRERKHPYAHTGPKEHPETYRIREHRLGVTNSPPEIRAQDAEIPVVRSKHGFMMSPQPPVVAIRKGGRKDGELMGYERDTVDYEPRVVDGAGAKIKDGVKRITGIKAVKEARETQKLNQQLAAETAKQEHERTKTQEELDQEYEARRQAGKKLKRKL